MLIIIVLLYIFLFYPFQYTTNADQTYVTGSSATTLTPTTLQQVVGLPHRVQSGFVPPVIDRAQQQHQATDMTKFSYAATYGDDDSEWAPAAKRMKVIRHTPALPQGHLVASQLTPPAPRRQGGRRPQDTSVSGPTVTCHMIQVYYIIAH